MNKYVQPLRANQWSELALRLILGATFVYASYDKILAPAAFAKIVYGYGLFPAVSINLIAVIIPFLELFTGVALITGVYPRVAALLAGGMLLAFITALSINLIRGYEFDCGCFSTDSGGRGNFAGFLILRDLALLALSAYIFFYQNPRRLSIQNIRGIQKT